MGQLPVYVTQPPEIGRFNEIVDLVLLARQQEPPESGFGWLGLLSVGQAFPEENCQPAMIRLSHRHLEKIVND
jgi:hypothetical protein